MSAAAIIGYERGEAGDDAVALGAELAAALKLEPVLAHAAPPPRACSVSAS